MSRITGLVRAQILAEGPDIPSEQENWDSQEAFDTRCNEYIDETLNAMPNSEFLSRISDAIEESLK